ncbi:MAG: 50S ribosomal protein L2 [Candidatus Hydrothermarchaeales archaeon]
MGKRITAQRRGKGTSVYKAPSHRYLDRVKHRRYDEEEKAGAVKGRIVDIRHDPARSAPVMEVQFETGEKRFVLGLEGAKVGDEIAYGTSAEVIQGNTLPLRSIPEGTPIHNVENRPGDGGRFIRASGTYGVLISREDRKTVVKLPSGGLKSLDSRCRATIGIVAGGGRRDKPFLKAGKMWHVLKPTAKYWPIVRKVAMNPVSHPHGGASGSPGKPTSVARGTPPGRKVGMIAPRRTGRK